jgi:hypothetical protein
MIEHRRLQIDARKWILAKALPKIYGDKLTAEVTGKDGGPIRTYLPAGRGRSVHCLRAQRATAKLDEQTKLSGQAPGSTAMKQPRGFNVAPSWAAEPPENSKIGR